MLLEVFKSVNHIGPEIGWDKVELVDPEINPQNPKRTLRRGAQIKLPIPKNTVCLNSFYYRAGQAWNRLPSDLKKADSLESFKREVSKLKIYCSCKLCSIF